MKYLKRFLESKTAPLINMGDTKDNELLDKVAGLARHKGKKILEIACGNGSDAIALYNMGFDVTATDSNQEYVDHINQEVENSKVEVDRGKIKAILHDTRKSFPATDGKFDLVFSRLGLHYFTEEELKEIFADIYRITKLYGHLVFTVKLTDDGKWGKKVLPTETWVKIVEESGFEIMNNETKSGKLYGEENTWLEVIAIKESEGKNLDKKLESYFDITWDFLSDVLTHFSDDHEISFGDAFFCIYTLKDKVVWFRTYGKDLVEVKATTSGNRLKYSKLLEDTSNFPIIEVVAEFHKPDREEWPFKMGKLIDDQFDHFDIPYRVIDMEQHNWSDNTNNWSIVLKHINDIK